MSNAWASLSPQPSVHPLSLALGLPVRNQCPAMKISRIIPPLRSDLPPQKGWVRLGLENRRPSISLPLHCPTHRAFRSRLLWTRCHVLANQRSAILTRLDLKSDSALSSGTSFANFQSGNRLHQTSTSFAFGKVSSVSLNS